MIEEPGFNTIEKAAVMKVMREAIQAELADSSAQKAQITLLNVSAHLKAIAELIGSGDYEAMCAHRLTHNIKHMHAKEQQAYLGAIESFAKAYSLVYSNKKLLLLMLYGIAHTTNSADAVSQYTSELYSVLRQRRERLIKRASAESETLESIRHELESNSNVLAKLFKRGRIRRLKRRLSAKTARVARLEKSIARYEEKARSIGMMLYK
ncbi:MAG: hypothetical protein QW091_00960 [Candidatus Micrarchaeaceae archaeon]